MLEQNNKAKQNKKEPGFLEVHRDHSFQPILDCLPISGLYEREINVSIIGTTIFYGVFYTAA